MDTIQKHSELVSLARKAATADKAATAARAALIGALISACVNAGYGLGLQKDIRAAYQAARKCDAKTAKRWHVAIVKELCTDNRISTGKASGPGTIELDPRAADPVSKAPKVAALPSARKAYDALQTRVVNLDSEEKRIRGQRLLDDLAALLALDI